MCCGGRLRSPRSVAACVILMSPSGLVLEYGTEGWLFALFGLFTGPSATARARSRRPARRSRSPPPSPTHCARSATTPSTQANRHPRRPYAGADRGPSRLPALALPAQPPEPAAALLRFCGRYSLEIYAVTLFAMQFLAYALGEAS